MSYRGKTFEAKLLLFGVRWKTNRPPVEATVCSNVPKLEAVQFADGTLRVRPSAPTAAAAAMKCFIHKDQFHVVFDNGHGVKETSQVGMPVEFTKDGIEITQG